MERVFIGSSREAMKYANAIHSMLSYKAEVTPWYAGVFGAQRYTMEDLETQLMSNDYAVFVFSPDDIVSMRGKDYFVPRDNTLFELGLFWGRLKRERVFFLIPDKLPNMQGEKRTEGYHLASDLSGLTVLTYEATRTDKNFKSAVSYACMEIQDRIEKLKKFEHPEVTIDSLKSVVLFFSQFTSKIMTRDGQHYDKLIDALRNSYNARCVDYFVKGAALWEGNKEEIKQIAGNVGKGKVYPITINTNLKDGESKILVVESFLNSCVEYIDTSVGGNVVKELILCYPIGTNYVISIHLNGYKLLEEEQYEILDLTNQGLIGSIHKLFGGEWS